MPRAGRSPGASELGGADELRELRFRRRSSCAIRSSWRTSSRPAAGDMGGSRASRAHTRVGGLDPSGTRRGRRRRAPRAVRWRLLQQLIHVGQLLPSRSDEPRRPDGHATRRSPVPNRRAADARVSCAHRSPRRNRPHRAERYGGGSRTAALGRDRSRRRSGVTARPALRRRDRLYPLRLVRGRLPDTRARARRNRWGGRSHSRPALLYCMRALRQRMPRARHFRPRRTRRRATGVRGDGVGARATAPMPRLRLHASTRRGRTPSTGAAQVTVARL